MRQASTQRFAAIWRSCSYHVLLIVDNGMRARDITLMRLSRADSSQLACARTYCSAILRLQQSLAESDVSEAAIMSNDRWKSAAYQRYIKPDQSSVSVLFLLSVSEPRATGCLFWRSVANHDRVFPHAIDFLAQRTKREETERAVH